MEAKRFGVKISLLKELRLFQLMLKKKRKMMFNVVIEGNVGRRETYIITREQRIVLDNCSYYIERNNCIDRGPTKISLILYGVMEMNITFKSRESKQLFYQEIYGDCTPSPEKES